jgi:hypothetical protein
VASPRSVCCTSSSAAVIHTACWWDAKAGKGEKQKGGGRMDGPREEAFGVHSGGTTQQCGGLRDGERGEGCRMREHTLNSARVVVPGLGVAGEGNASGNKDSIDGGGSWVKFSAKRLGAPFGAQPSAADRPRLRAPEVPPVRALPRGTDPTTTRHREGEPWCPLSEHPRWDPRGQGVRWTRPARRNKKWEEIFRRQRRLQAASNKEYIRGEAKQAYPGRFLRL